MRTKWVRSQVLERIRCFDSRKKRIISSATIILFSLFTISCTYTKMVKVEPGKDYENQRIVGFVKTNGEEVDLPKGTPRIIKKNVIEMQGQYEIRLDDIRSVERQSDKDGVDRIWKIIARDGRIFFPKSLIIKKETYAFATNEPISIPLSETERSAYMEISS